MFPPGVVLFLDVIRVPQVAYGMEDRVVFPLLCFRSVEGIILGVAFVEDAPVGTPFFDAASFEGSRAHFPPSACVNRNRLDTGVDVAQLVALLAGADHAGNKGQHGGQADGSTFAWCTQALPYLSDAFH